MTDGLRVLTMNLLAPQKGDYERRRPVPAEGLRRLRPDVAAFQETVWGDGTDQPADGVWASDHFGVVADLRLPRRPPGAWA